MKTLDLVNGDLVVGPQGHRTVTGTAKIRQDLSLALGTEIGTDRFHPSYGSTLPNMIGRPLVSGAVDSVRSEVARVAQTYIATQQTQVQDDALNGRRSRFDASDVVVGVTAVDASADRDVVRVSASLLTQAGTQVQVTRTVS